MMSIKEASTNSVKSKIAWDDIDNPIPVDSYMLQNEFKSFKLHKSTKTNDNNEESFHRCIYPVIVLAQVFALMPVYGISKENAKCLKFYKLSWKLLYSLTVIVSIAIMIFITILWCAYNQVEFNKIVSLIFYGSNMLCICLFGVLAKKWPSLMIFWEQVEKSLPQYETLKDKQKLRKYIKYLTIIVMILALVEHSLSILSGAYKIYKCSGINDDVEGYFKQSFPQLFYFTSFNIIKATGAQFVNLFCTFAWNFMDVFIIVISIAITTRMNQVNYHLNLLKYQIIPDIHWEIYRSQYLSICNLVEEIDIVLAPLMLLSFSNNLFFVCMQLLHSLSPLDNNVHAVYFWYSLIFLILRTFSVSLYCSKIHDESRKPLDIFYKVPKHGWTEVVQRFFTQVRDQKIALSGMKFFYITRTLIIKIAGTVVTYELVLVQFRTADESADTKDPCT